MEGRQQESHSPEFKAKVALVALKGDKTIEELVQQFDVDPNEIADWKKQLQENMAVVFGEKRGKEKEADMRRMQAQ